MRAASGHTDIAARQRRASCPRPTTCRPRPIQGFALALPAWTCPLTPVRSGIAEQTQRGVPAVSAMDDDLHVQPRWRLVVPGGAGDELGSQPPDRNIAPLGGR